MWNWLLTRSLGWLLIILGGATMTWAAETLNALDLVSADAAFCLEIPHLEETWTMLEACPLMNRLSEFPAYQRLRESAGFQHWQAFEDHVTKMSGQKLSAQLRALFSKSLVLAIYVPPRGIPQGILIGEAADATAIMTAFDTWNKLEPSSVTSVMSHRGYHYFQRKRDANAAESVYFASSGRWFAISDRESLIQDVIDRFVAATAASPQSTIADSLRLSNVFSKNRERLKKDGAAYAHINARPWDRSLEESSQGMHEPINPAAVWKHVEAISACLQLDRGLVCDAVIELDTAHLPLGWSQFVATASGDPSWSGRIPAEAILAVGGHLELAPFMYLALGQIQPEDLAEFTKIRRIARSLFGGQDLFEVVLPALSRDFYGFVVPRNDGRTKRVVLDGMLGFTLDSSSDTKLLQDISHGLETTLNMLAAYFSAEGEDVVTVNGEQTNSTQLRWLSESASVPVAYGLKGRNLVIAGSQERLRRSLEPQFTDNSVTRLTDHSRRFFPNANQLVWIDTAQARQLLERNGADIVDFFTQGSVDDSKRWENRFEHVRPALELLDSLFVAGRVESDHIRITFGGGLDSK